MTAVVAMIDRVRLMVTRLPYFIGTRMNTRRSMVRKKTEPSEAYTVKVTKPIKSVI